MFARKKKPVAVVTDEDEATAAIRSWATGMSARTLWPDQAEPWVLKTRRARRSLRRTAVVFPHPMSLTDAQAAARWEVRARVAAAEHASSGNFSNWFATLMAGVVFGGAWSSVIATLDPSGGWLKFVGAMIASGIVFGLLTILLLAAAGRTLIRLYERAPMWQARADAYARRRTDLECVSRSRRDVLPVGGSPSTRWLSVVRDAVTASVSLSWTRRR